MYDCDGPFKIVWDFFCMALIFYEIIAIPFSISFDVDLSDVFDIIVNLIFVTDIVLNFNTSYYFNGNPIVNRKKIAIRYLKFWFWIDLSACFPYSQVIEFSM